MIPSTWRPYFRERDGELVGYLDGTDPIVIPRTLFGYPLAPAGLAGDATRLLDERGLACLGDRWVLSRGDGERVDVLIMSAYADRVEVVETEYGYYGPDSPRHTLTAPTGDRLQPA
ncbi:hypothetical protein GCM10022204_12950 [Microlunatus aurantiacus]|uniref:Uncharacterized protein n=1 Tax=Microlunatus aurantiacus TaxID=446786 RepID=A0ABP7D1T6_9ACTN